MARCFASFVLFLAGSVATADQPAVAPLFKDVKPIFQKHCQVCHNPDMQRGGLDLSSRTSILSGSDSGKAAIPGKPNESPLYLLTAHLETPHMPPNQPKLSARDLETLRKWIAAGLPEKPEDIGKIGIVQAPSTESKKEPQPKSKGLPFAGEAPLQAVAVTALAVSPDGALLATPGVKMVYLWDLVTLKPIGALPFEEGDIHTLKFSADGKVLIGGGGEGAASGRVVGWEMPSGRRLFELGEESDVVLSADLRTDGKQLALGGPGRSVKLFSTVDGSQQHIIRKHADWIHYLAYSPDGLLLATADRNGGIFVWESQTAREFLNLRGHAGAITALSWRHDGDQLASASLDGTIRIWDMHTGKTIREWQAHNGGVLSLHWHKDGSILTCGRDQQTILWDATGKKLLSFEPGKEQILRVARNGDGSRVVDGDYLGTIRVFTRDGKVLGKLPHGGKIGILETALAAAPKRQPEPMPMPKVVEAGKPTTSTLREELLRAVQQAREQHKQHADERDQAARALLEAESAVAAAEEALKRAKDSAAAIRKIALLRAEAARMAEKRLADIEAELQKSSQPITPSER